MLQHLGSYLQDRQKVLTIIDEDPAAPKNLSAAAKRAAELPSAPDAKKSKTA